MLRRLLGSNFRKLDSGLRSYGITLSDVSIADDRNPLVYEAIRRYGSKKYNEKQLRYAIATDLQLKKSKLPTELQAPEGSAIEDTELLDIYKLVVQEDYDRRNYKSD